MAGKSVVVSGRDSRLYNNKEAYVADKRVEYPDLLPESMRTKTFMSLD